MKTIQGEIKKCRRGEHLSHRKYRRWLRFFAEDKIHHIEEHLLKFAEGKLTRVDLEKLFREPNAQRYIGNEKCAEYLRKFDSGKLSEDDLEKILDNVYAVHFYIDQLIEGATGISRLDSTYDEFRKEYIRASSFLSKDRRLMEHLIYVFLTPEEMQSRRAQGWTDKQIIKEFVDVCFSENLYPCINDNPIIFGKGADGCYKPLSLSSWTKTLMVRIRGIASEIERSGREVIALESRGINPGLPSADGKLEQALQLGQDPYRRIGLPMPKITCPFPECGHSFDSDEKLRVHLVHQHKAKP
jgi:hypothetical protein